MIAVDEVGHTALILGKRRRTRGAWPTAFTSLLLRFPRIAYIANAAMYAPPAERGAQPSALDFTADI